MKELKLLAEDWKGEIDPNKADFKLSCGGLYLRDNPLFGELRHDGRYYIVHGHKPIELTPEPRPADSIKLSECGPEHMIVAENMAGQFIRVSAESGRIITRDIRSCSVVEHSSFSSLAMYEELTGIRIYDMTK